MYTCSIGSYTVITITAWKLVVEIVYLTKDGVQNEIRIIYLRLELASASPSPVQWWVCP